MREYGWLDPQLSYPEAFALGSSSNEKSKWLHLPISFSLTNSLKSHMTMTHHLTKLKLVS